LYTSGNKLPTLQIIENLRPNYLKIVSNIYYLNLLKIQKQVKTLNKNQINPEIVDTLYKTYLKETRRQVLNHFHIVNTTELSPKTALRIFTYYLSPYDEVSIRNRQLLASCNHLISEIETCGMVEELVKHVDDIKPKDVYCY
jgi:hypothetical protein